MDIDELFRSDQIMFLVSHHSSGTLWLILERMELATVHKHWLALVLGVMWHRVVSLRIVEPDDEEREGADHMLLEWHLGHVRLLEYTLLGEDVILVLVEVLLDVAAEHI